MWRNNVLMVAERPVKTGWLIARAASMNTLMIFKIKLFKIFSLLFLGHEASASFPLPPKVSGARPDKEPPPPPIS